MKAKFLGGKSATPNAYDKRLLDALPRPVRQALGVDVWRAFEVSWLHQGFPKMAWGLFQVPADSPRLLESKSVKLYLQSLNQHEAGPPEEVRSLLGADLSRACGAGVRVGLYSPGSADPVWAPLSPPGRCLEDPAAPKRRERGRYYTRLFRCLCPVTGQPDWATVLVACPDAALDEGRLLEYLLSFRQGRTFHEDAVQKIFTRLSEWHPSSALCVEAVFARRGGISISPCRHSPGFAPPPPRNYGGA